MANSTIKFKHTFSLSPQWRQKFVDELGATILNNPSIMEFDKKMASGNCFFTEIIPGLSVLLIDAVINTPIEFTRLASEDDFWIIYFDLSDTLNKHRINKHNFEIGDRSKFGLGVLDSHISSTYVADEHSCIYSLRIFIDKKLVAESLKKIDLNQQFKGVFDRNKKKVFFYKHIDSRSKIELFSLKKQSIKGPNYDLKIKSTVYNLLAYFFERASEVSTAKVTYEKDVEAINRSQDFLISNLYHPFPGIDELSRIANMSASKYNKLYKIIYGMSPASYFKDRKLELSRELLSSGHYKYINDIALELGYSKTTYFTMIFKNNFGYLPSVIFIKKEE
ncbi:helix-turn-helix transcriptional regulator [Flavobacterium sp. HSC-61S13]|uniref:helix-turn-helix transcriptional regulator n=1 Tax=Flavobacterium sp. HSC-61S13 TaxID=2910963 RepID=UPI00209E4E79|nr:AraC family transcriptional regulator [Flavobacterium sp. HSC-61S13]MCP1994674.1 AraC-like DNA-binding protein [Flavobacterium sp. HSC-61S13]